MVTPPLPRPKPLPTAAQSGTPEPNQGVDLRSGWQEFLSKPENRAGLLQFGLSMLNPVNPGGSLASNIGGAMGEGFAVRGATLQAQNDQAADEAKGRRDEEDHQSKLQLRKAQTARALRPPQGRASDSTKGEMTPKDRAKEWFKYAKDRRKEDPDISVADLKTEFDEVWNAAGGTPAAPQTAGQAATQISQMTLEQLMALDRTKLTSEQLKEASTRYNSLSKK